MSPDVWKAERYGMTMIELSIVMGIVSMLLALVLGLARHVDAAIKIRRAQADLAEWHDTMERWHQKFGQYPYARIDVRSESGTDTPLIDEVDWKLQDLTRYPLTTFTNRCEISIWTNTEQTETTNITLRSFLATAINTIDPWGTPYIYLPSEDGASYELFSCGPDRITRPRRGISIGSGSARLGEGTEALDDIYFER